MSVFDGMRNLSQARPVFGDVIAVHRLGGIYDHYGVYKDDGCVYEYAGSEGDYDDVCVRMSALKKFIGDSGSCFVVPFPERYQDFAASRKLPAYMQSDCQDPTLEAIRQFAGQISESIREAHLASAYHLFTPEETIQRAHSRLGERKYSLPFNNCEHFAIWCKTGLSDSGQVDAVLKLLQPLVIEAAVRMADPLFREQLGDRISSLGDSFAGLTDFFGGSGKQW